MTGIQLLILLGILVLSFSVLALLSPRIFHLALRFLLNTLFGLLALSILSMLWPAFPVGVNLWTLGISTLLGLPGILLLVAAGIWF